MKKAVSCGISWQPSFTLHTWENESFLRHYCKFATLMICRCDWPICKNANLHVCTFDEKLFPLNLEGEAYIQYSARRERELRGKRWLPSMTYVVVVLIQINEFKVNSSDSNQLDEEHIGSVSTLSPHDNQLQLLKFQESRYLWERNRSTVYMWNER